MVFLGKGGVLYERGTPVGESRVDGWSNTTAANQGVPAEGRTDVESGLLRDHNLRGQPLSCSLRTRKKTPLQSSARNHKRPFVGVSEPRSWSHWLVFVNIWRESPMFPEKSVKVDF